MSNKPMAVDTLERLFARAEAAEARCKRLDRACHAALAVMSDLYDPLRMSEEDHQRAADLADQLNAALSDTAQPCKGCGGSGEIDPAESAAGCPLCGGTGKEPLPDPVAEMRERVAKLVEDMGNTNLTYVFRNDAAKAIRALPIDPETGGADA